TVAALLDPTFPLGRMPKSPNVTSRPARPDGTVALVDQQPLASNASSTVMTKRGAPPTARTARAFGACGAPVHDGKVSVSPACATLSLVSSVSSDPRTKTSKELFVSLATRLVASLVNATKRPSAEMAAA